MTNKTTGQIEREIESLDSEVVIEVLRRGKSFLEQGKSPEEIFHKLVGDKLIARKNDYLKALPHYEAFGEVPNDVIRNNQLLYLGLIDKAEYAETFRNLVKKYGARFSDEDVKSKFVGELQDGHSCFLTGPANTKNHKSLVKLIEDEVRVKFDRSFIRKAYVAAINEGYGHCVQNVFSNSNYEPFKPKTKEEYEAVKELIKKNVRADSLATPEYVQNLPVITGISPSYELLLQVGKYKAREVIEKRMHPGYMEEYAESVRAIGLPVLAKHLYKISGIKYPKEKPHKQTQPQQVQKRNSLLTRLFGGKK